MFALRIEEFQQTQEDSLGAILAIFFILAQNVQYAIDAGVDVAADGQAHGGDERNIEVGRAFFKMSTKQALADLEELREGLRLRQVARILKLYATALSGKDVMIRATDELDGLELMSVDHIALPGEMGAYEDDDNNFRAYKVATAHGAGRIEFGTYRFRLADIAETVDLLERRYPEAS